MLWHSGCCCSERANHRRFLIKVVRNALRFFKLINHMSIETSQALPQQPNAGLTLLGHALEAVLNRVVALDIDTQTRLQAIEGKAIHLEFKDTHLSMRIAVANSRITIGPGILENNQLRISATPGSLLAMLLNRGPQALLPSGHVEISGDAQLARHIERIAAQFAPDIDEAFTDVFGDVVGFQLARGFRHAFRWGKTSAQTLLQDTVDYLQEESRDLIAKTEMEHFLEGVDELGSRGERLQARVLRLTERIQGYVK